MQMQVNEGSPRMKLDWTDIVSVLKGAGLAFTPAIGLFLKSVDWATLDFANADWYLLISAAASVLLNLARKYFTDTKEIVRKEIVVALVGAMMLFGCAGNADAGPLCHVLSRVASMRPGILIPKRGPTSACYHAPARRCCGAPAGSCYCLPQNGGCRCDESCPCGPPVDDKPAYKVRVSIKGSDGKQLGEIDPTTGQVVWEISQLAAESATVTVVTMQGCQPCTLLKKAFATSEHLKPYNATFVDRAEARELVRTLGIKSFPTLVVTVGNYKPPVLRKSGFDGNAKKLADEIAAAIKRHKSQRRPAVRIGRRMANDPRFQVLVG